MMLYDVSSKEFVFNEKFDDAFDSKGCFTTDGKIFAYTYKPKNEYIEIRLFNVRKKKITGRIRGFGPGKLLSLAALQNNNGDSLLVTGVIKPKDRPWTGVDCFRDFGELAELLKNPKTEGQKCIRENLSQSAKDILDKYNENPLRENELLEVVILNFNFLINRENFGTVKKFSAVNDTEEARQIKRTGEFGTESKDKQRLNRLLLRSVYPGILLPMDEMSLIIWNVKDQTIAETIPVDGLLDSHGIYPVKNNLFYFTQNATRTLTSVSLSTGEKKTHLKDIIEENSSEELTDISNDGRFLAILYDIVHIKVYDIENNKVLWDRKAIKGIGQKIIFSPDSRYLGAGSSHVRKMIFESGQLLLFNPETGRQIKSFKNPDRQQKR